MDKKRKSGVPHRSGRRSFLGNQHTSNDDTEQTSVAAKKLKNADPQLEVKIHPLLTYVIVQWSVFATLQQRVVCAKCNKKVEFAKSVEKGLGFELQIICDCEESEPIPSSPKIKNGYEINRRIVYAMRLLGVGFYGLLNFCGLMDISATALSITGYYKCIEQVYIALKAFDRKYTNKVIDVIVKSKICQACDNYSKKFPENTPEFDAWFTEHCEAGNCTRDHDGSAGLIEVEGVEEMFRMSVEQYGVMYEYYIGDGDSKTFKRLEESEPFGEAVKIKKKACVLHVGKSIYRRGKEAKKNHAKIKKALEAQKKRH
ncbi:hypothetical protein JTB14_025669 [Gonioctena quinquepunctata]|nr:hypothetical protein JTB14_025669 [Gonioctena quinquepunctata]